MQNENLIEWPIEHKYGICRISLLSLYLEPRPGAGLFTQLLFGETYEVLGMTPDGKWLKVRHQTDIIGWIFTSQHEPIGEAAYDTYNEEDYQVVTSPVSTIRYQGELLYLMPGSHLHIGSSELFDMGSVLEFSGTSKHVKKKASREELVELAKKFINVPFLSGGRGFFGIGAGSFIQLVYKLAGFPAPKFISLLLSSGKPIAFEEIQLGDVVIFGNKKDIPHHAGIYIGDSQVIHVKGKVRVDSVKLDGAKMTHIQSPFYQVLDIRNLL